MMFRPQLFHQLPQHFGHAGAAGLLHYAPATCPVFVIDPHQPEAGRRGVRYIAEAASTGVPKVLAELAG